MNKKEIIKFKKKTYRYALYIILFLLILILLPIIILKLLGVKLFIFLFFLIEFLNILLLSKERKINKKDKINWLFLLLFFPFLGNFLFIYFIVIQKNKKNFKIKKNYDSIFLINNFEKINKDLTHISYNNYQKVLIQKNFYIDLIEEIKKAKRTIYIQIYIIRYDEVTSKIFDNLICKAKQGLKIRLLIDVCGSLLFPLEKLKYLLDNNINICFFNQKNLNFFDLLYVNHRKRIIIDNNIAYIGGFNLGKEYIHGYKKKNLKWFDAMIKIKGELVKNIQSSFILDWNFSVKNINKNININKKYFSQNNSLYNKSILNKKCEYILGGPDKDSYAIINKLKELIDNSKKNIFISTPYFIPSTLIMESLKKALKRGVKIVIIIPGKPDKKFVYLCTLLHAKVLLQYNAKIYKCDNYFVHSKIYCFDKKTIMYGTVNMDMRSFFLNFEEMIISYDDKILLREINNIFYKLINLSTKLKYEDLRKTKLTTKILELVSLILKPIF